MLGALIGDFCGSSYEFNNLKSKELELFKADAYYTDDSVLTCAVAEALLTGTDLAASLRWWGREYPHASYGGMFRHWVHQNNAPAYGSFGNGSAMRVSPCGWAADSETMVLEMARWSALPTHDHPEGIKGAQATALAIFWARRGASNAEIRSGIENRFKYDLSLDCARIRPDYQYDVSCQGSVPQAFAAFFDANGYEDAIRNAISLGGDSDTIGAICGGIAEARWGVPEEMERQARERMDCRMAEVVDRFRTRWIA